MQAVHLVVLPQMTIYLVLPLKVLIEVHQYRYRLTRHIPSAHLHHDALLLLGIVYPCAKRLLGSQVFVSHKVRALFLFPTIGTDKDNMIWKFFL